MSDVGSTNEATDRQSTINHGKISEIKLYSEEIVSDSNSQVLSGIDIIKQNTALLKEMKSDWIKASYEGFIKRIHLPPKSLEELKVVFCTRF